MSFLLPFKFALKNLSANKARTALTLVGIVIGITSVILISASGQGVKQFVLGQVESFGSDSIQIEPKVPTSKNGDVGATANNVQITTLKIEDAEATLKLPNIKSFYAGSIGQSLGSYGNTNKKIMLFGASEGAPAIDSGLKIRDGRFYSESENDSLAQVTVIGQEVEDTFFGRGEGVGKEIRIKGKKFRVIGVLEERGTVGFISFDSMAYIPIKTLQKKILGVDHILFFTVKMKDASQTEDTVSSLRFLLRDRHDIEDEDKEDFSVVSMKEAAQMIKDVFNSINILLLALTSVSLIVGGVGIMNVMYVSVVERTFEIGLRKALGASAGSILKQFLTEAVIITLLGGAIGIILGFLLSALASYAFGFLGYNLKFQVTWDGVLLATGFSVLVGLIFGFYPAYKASKLSPMEAIRRN